MKTLVQMTDREGRLVLPPKFAGCVVVVEVDDAEDKVVIRRASVQGMDPGQLTATSAELAGTSNLARKIAIPPPLAAHAHGRRNGHGLPATISVQGSGRVLVDGYPLTRFLKSLGLADWSNMDASRLLVTLADLSGVDELREIAEKSTVSCQVGDGRKMRRGEEPSHVGGDPVPLTTQQLRALRDLVETSRP